jgi:hypothetical protein
MTQSKILVAAAAAILSALPLASAYAADLPTVSRQNVQNEVQKADRPVVLLSCPVVESTAQLNCGAGEDAVAQQVAKHPELKFVKVNGGEFGLENGLYVFVPGAGVTFKQPGFDAAKADDAFYNQRSQFAAQEAAAAANLKAVREKLNAAAKPVDEKMNALQARDEQLYAESRTKLKAVGEAEKQDPTVAKLEKQVAAKSAPYDKRLAALEKQYQAVQAQREAALAPVNKKLDAAKAPFVAQRKQVRTDLEGAEAELSKQADAVQKERADVRKPFVADVTKAQKALTEIVQKDQPAQ